MMKRRLFLFGVLAVAFLALNGATFSGQTAATAPAAEGLCPTCGGGDACTVIMVGKAASTDGSVMTTHTCDCGTCDWTFRRIPAADHKPGDMRKIYHIGQFDAWSPDIGL
jgi:dipeptidase